MSLNDFCSYCLAAFTFLCYRVSPAFSAVLMIDFGIQTPLLFSWLSSPFAVPPFPGSFALSLELFLLLFYIPL